MKVSKMKSIVLFDMDGTLTPARKPIEIFMVQSLRRLSEISRIGIVSGSDFDYVMQQCSSLFDVGGIDLRDIDLLPCNGTKFYSWKNTQFELSHEENMMTLLNSQYQDLVREILKLQSEIINTEMKDSLISGTFLQYRGSMLNWCAIGRDAVHDIREQFILLDKKEKIRKMYRKRLQKFIKDSNMPIQTALGGDTSIDIYPEKWDKTYALRHYRDHKVFFIGDRCEEGGNDRTLFEKLSKVGTAFKTSDPKQTARIIENNIIPQIKEM